MRNSFTALIVTGILMIGSVEGAENRVTLLAENQPLGEVLQSIQKASGVAVVLADKKWTNDPVTCSVKNLELEKALGVVFGGYNYVLAFEADKGAVSKILVTVYEKKMGAVVVPTVKKDTGDNGKPLKGRELTLFMAAEIERRREIGCVTPAITESQRIAGPSMADMVHRMGRVKLEKEGEGR